MSQFQNVAEDFLFRPAETRAASPALYFEDQVLTYGDLVESTQRTCALFRKLGLELEQRVLLMLPDVPQFASAWFAAVQAGGVVAAVNPEQKPEEAEYYLNYTRAKILVAHRSTFETVTTIRENCPHLKHVLWVGTGEGTEAGADLDYDRAIAAVTPDSQVAETHPDDPAVWLFTSGSTGFPKAAVHKQHDFLFNAERFGLPILGLGPNDIGLSVPKLAFGYALGTNLLFPLLSGGSSVIFPGRPTPEVIFSLIAKHRPTVLTAVPTAINGMLNDPGLDKVDFSSLRICISAGEALPAELYERWKARTGLEILDGIGSAEMFHIFITNRLGDVRLGSLGRLVEGYQAKICDDDDKEVPHGEIGTLWVSGDSMALEYWQQHDKSKQTFRGDWCVSADKFRRDAEGYFYFCGRGDDMLKVNGKWLSPLEVENALLAHPAVLEAAVIGFKDTDGLEKPKAFLVLHPSHTRSDDLAEAIKLHVRNALSPYKAPRQVLFVDALPKSDRGKILKSALRG